MLPIRHTPFLDSSVSIREICDALERAYGNPRHGNQSDPLDELVYIILSTRTADRSFRASFDQLKQTCPDWNDVDATKLPTLEAVLTPSGLGRLKARQLVAIFDRLRVTFGRVTLDPLWQMTDREAEEFLVSLPGVAAKIAKCVLMYSLGRQVLPVDVHVHRVSSRLGFRVKKRPDTSQDLIEEVVPSELRYGFHVNCVAHGRSVCLPRVPRCERCCIAQWCAYYHYQCQRDEYAQTAFETVRMVAESSQKLNFERRAE